jgi:peptidoglycan/xylan/chitin deacetylase (PgdA/CDA1 family)
MEHLKASNLSVIPLNDIVACIKCNDPFPPKSVAITFDDGFKNFYQTAFPLLKQFNFNTTVFLVPGYCGKNNQWPGQPNIIPSLELLNWDEMKEMADHGIEFGAHTMSHQNLSSLSTYKAVHEIVYSKSLIEKNLCKKVTFFAYPYGEVNEHIKAVVMDHYLGACSTLMGFVSVESDIYQLPRIDMFYFSNNSFFNYIGTPLFSLYIAFRGLLRFIRMNSRM